MLSFAALRACRLVVDTGMHHLGWSRQQAIDFMYAHTATTRANVRNEIDRYIGWPGQALAYVTGRREIVRLRERAEPVLGPRFELRRFHHAVLRNGAVPLTVLDDESRALDRHGGTSMNVTINGCELNVEVMGPKDGPVLIAHHGGGGIGSLAEPRATFGPLADRFRVVVFDARGCGHSEGIPPYSHAQWAADVEGLREWTGADKIVIAGGSYGGFIALEYAVAYPERVQAIVLRDTSADASNLELAFENARNQDRVEINWDNFNRYWSGQIRDDEDLKARWAEIIPLYDYEYDPVRSAARVESGVYRHEAHNWCFQHNQPNYDLKPQLPSITAPALVTVGRRDWVTPVSAAETIASLIPGAKLVVFEKSGHSPQIEERELFLSTVRDFLDSAVPQR